MSDTIDPETNNCCNCGFVQRLRQPHLTLNDLKYQKDQLHKQYARGFEVFSKVIPDLYNVTATTIGDHALLS